MSFLGAKVYGSKLGGFRCQGFVGFRVLRLRVLNLTILGTAIKQCSQTVRLCWEARPRPGKTARLNVLINGHVRSAGFLF